ncbi:unnamed protein product, partial [Allacma fusca]
MKHLVVWIRMQPRLKYLFWAKKPEMLGDKPMDQNSFVVQRMYE